MYVSMVPFHRPAVPKPAENLFPFMNNMDEITYWIYTKRAPCLMNYDNQVKNQTEVAQCSKDNATTVHSVTRGVPLSKKKKRKLSLFDDDSISTEKPLNVIHASRSKKRPVLSYKSDSGSDIDFNIKRSSIKQKTKRTKLSRSRALQKKNKIITSTPKPITTTLRRSVRQAQLNNNQLNSSLAMAHTNIQNGSYHNNHMKNTDNNYCTEDQTPNHKKVVNEQIKNMINGQLEDLSDVSGFTANYIRSAKAQSNKNASKLNCKGTRKLLKESKNSQKESAMIICANKSVNTGLINAPINCSTDSDQHIINLVSPQDKKPTTVDKGTSILKFMDMKSKKSLPKGNSVKLNISFQSQNSSRYPKRHKPATHTTNLNSNTANISSEFNSSDRKENPGDKLSRTRSGRNIGLSLRQPGNSVLVLSNSMEQVSSMVSMNVATPDKEKKRLTRQARTRQSEKRNSVMERSGFAACFSDSDDSQPLQRKFFCA
ncbi:hypothetical protein K1T71_009043 [Dendrolimus kikuchii]|uniref:Uncharacterized protein n=1 Tax=Dendrolimus kikuchii TaxID=765133 RepID=A0ACC1CWL5_9NEOP|nr:hypothetical protein K1T71_009043 [Dendrolimus kikuchii]